MNYFSIKAKEIVEEIRFRTQFPDPIFRRIDRSLWWAYFGKNPYTISRNFLQGAGVENVHQYGETPLLTIDQIAREAEIKATDHLFDLGCGRGRSCFFLNHFYKCRVTAIDWIDTFISKGAKIAENYRLDVTFKRGDILTVDLSNATVIYLYGTCLEDAVIKALLERIQKGTRVISVSYPLSDYDPKFTCTHRFVASYPWGKTEVYINE